MSVITPDAAAAPATRPDEESVDSPTRLLLRAMEELTRATREASHVMARQFACSRGEVPLIRLLARRGPLGVADIAQCMRVDVSVVSRQASHLVDNGWVERTVDPADRRARPLRLTRAGEALAGQVLTVRDGAMQVAFDGWTTAELHDAVEVLRRLAVTIDDAQRRERPPLP